MPSGNNLTQLEMSAKRINNKAGAATKAKSSRAIQRVTAPVAKSIRGRNTNPQFAVGKRGGVRVKHREYTADILSDPTDNALVNSFAINPGMDDLFPWLSGIALNYESYKIHSLSFNVVGTQPTSGSGYIAAAVDFDALDPSPTSKQQMLNFSGAMRCPVWGELTLHCPKGDLSKLGPDRYVRFGTVADSDVKTYDVGRLIVMRDTPNVTLDNVIAELYVEYDIEFFTPQLRPNEASFVQCMRFATTTCSAASPWNGMAREGGALGAISSKNGGYLGPIIRDAGSYLVEMIGTGTGIPTPAFPTPVGSDAVVTLLGSQLTDTGAGTAFVQWAVERIGRSTDAAYQSSTVMSKPANLRSLMTGWTTLAAASVMVTKYLGVKRSLSTHVRVVNDEENNFQVWVPVEAAHLYTPTTPQ